MENVVHLESPLERLAGRIRADLAKCKQGREEWIEGAFNLCIDLAEARRQYPGHKNDKEFGKWCSDNGFGDDVINENERASIIKMGKQPDALRKCLNATTRHGLLQIYRKEFGMYGQPSIHTSPKKPPRKKAATPKLDVAQEAVRERIENNEPVDRHGLAKELDISHWTVEMARQRELGRREGLDEQLDPAFIDSLKPADKKRFDKAVAAEVERCLIEERRALHEEYSGYIKWMNDKNERAERILNSHKGLISREKFRKIKACLHPDHNTFVFAAEAIQIFSELEDILVKPEEPVKVGPAFPVSVADMMARRNARKRR